MSELQARPIVLSDAIKDLVIARLDLIPPNLGVSIGGQGNFTKDELIEHVKKGILLDEILKISQPEFAHG